jgi:hypothetical protein
MVFEFFAVAAKHGAQWMGAFQNSQAWYPSYFL